MKKIFEIQLGREKLIAEINDLAEKASGSCFIRYGGSMVLSTVTASKEEKENIEFFPLTVEYEERYYAAGKIKGPRFVKRETRPSDEAICNARMIDRALRPLFPLEFKREVQIINTVLSWDAQNDPDILGLIGSSLALSISAIPWGGPVGAVRVGKIGENFILNPTYEEKEKSEMDVVFSGIEKDGDILVNMIEGGFERSKEETILEAFDFAKPYLKLLIDFQKEIAKTLGAKKIEIQKEEEKEIKNAILEHFGEKIQNAFLPKESKEGS
ncbi:polyribonucleotide nucleotidyltransferase, partial [Candidatus Parcubacteria bacterium]|nr:polyribonucleotide nucleotidyltransferase [Candidatus Parcubacteria bacterium]